MRGGAGRAPARARRVGACLTLAPRLSATSKAKGPPNRTARLVIRSVRRVGEPFLARRVGRPTLCCSPPALEIRWKTKKLKMDTDCTALSLIPTVNGNTVRSFNYARTTVRSQGGSSTVSRSDIRLIQHLDLSAHGLVRRGRSKLALFPYPHRCGQTRVTAAPPLCAA